MHNANIVYKVKSEDELRQVKRILEDAPFEIGFTLEASLEENEIYATQVTLTPTGTDRILRDHILADDGAEVEEFQSTLTTLYVVTYQRGDKKAGILIVNKSPLRQLRSGMKRLLRDLSGQPTEET